MIAYGFLKYNLSNFNTFDVMKMFINLFHKYLLHICYLLTTILDAEDVAVKTNPCLDGAS